MAIVVANTRQLMRSPSGWDDVACQKKTTAPKLNKNPSPCVMVFESSSSEMVGPPTDRATEVLLGFVGLHGCKPAVRKSADGDSG